MEKLRSHSTSRSAHFCNSDVSYWKSNEETKQEQRLDDCCRNYDDNGAVKRREQRSQTDEQSVHIYEDIDPKAPPRIAPVSGVLGSSNAKSLLKPMAFKPVVTFLSELNENPSPLKKNRFACSPFSSVDFDETNSSSKSQINNNNNSLSTPKSSLSQSYGSSSRNSFFTEDENLYSELNTFNAVHASELFLMRSRNASNIASDEYCAQTPSPSDSGITELEAILREKDSEINYLRETLEQNEQVIFKVYAEKEQSWRREVSKIRHRYEEHIRNYQRKLSKAEQMSFSESEAFSMERQTLRTEINELKKRNSELEKQNNVLESDLYVARCQLQDAEWTVNQNSDQLNQVLSKLNESHGNDEMRDAEINALKNQLKETVTFAESKSLQSLKLMEKLNSFQNELLDSKRNAECSMNSLQQQFNATLSEVKAKYNVIQELKFQNETLTKDLKKLREQFAACEQQFHKERYQWIHEKQRVVVFHKQLQSSYLHVYKRHKEAQQQIKNLSFALKNITVNETRC